VEPRFLDVKLSRRGSWVAALVLFALAFGFRLAGIGWGLPNELRNQSMHPDENLNYIVATQTPYLQPGFYNYGTLFFTLVHVANDAGTSYGWIPQPQPENQADVFRSGIQTGRVLSALSGAATVSLVFATLLLLTGTLGAFIGAAAMLLAPGHVVHSRFLTTDVFAAMLIALAAFLVIKALQQEENPTLKALIAIGAVVGLAAGTKYTGVLMLLPALYVLFARKEQAKSYLALVASALFGFFIATPGVLIETSAFARDFMYEVAHSAEGHGLVFVDTPPGFVFHSLNLAEAFGFFPFVIGGAGLIWGIVTKAKWAIASALFFLPYFAVISGAEVKFLRYVFPLLPFIAVGLGYIAGRCHELGGSKRIVTGVAILLVGFTSATTAGAFQLTRLMTTPDPRNQAAVWFRDESPSDTTIGLVSDPWFYTPSFFENVGALSFQDRLQEMQENPRLIRYIAPDGEKKDWDVRLLDLEPTYIVFSSFEFLDHDRLSEPNFVAFMERMQSEYDFIAIFWDTEPAFATTPEAMNFDRNMLRVIMRERYPKTHDMMYIRPTICVFKRKAD
jgi:hypothetical protein